MVAPRRAQEDHTHAGLVPDQVLLQTQNAYRSGDAHAPSESLNGYGPVVTDKAYRLYGRRRLCSTSTSLNYHTSIDSFLWLAPGTTTGGTDDWFPYSFRWRFAAANFDGGTGNNGWVVGLLSNLSATPNDRVWNDWTLEGPQPADIDIGTSYTRELNRFMMLGIRMGTLSFPAELVFGWRQSPGLSYGGVDGVHETGLMWSPGDLVTWDLEWPSADADVTHTVSVQTNLTDTAGTYSWSHPPDRMPWSDPAFDGSGVIDSNRFWLKTTGFGTRYYQTKGTADIQIGDFDWGFTGDVSFSIDTSTAVSPTVTAGDASPTVQNMNYSIYTMSTAQWNAGGTTWTNYTNTNVADNPLSDGFDITVTDCAAIIVLLDRGTWYSDGTLPADTLYSGFNNTNLNPNSEWPPAVVKIASVPYVPVAKAYLVSGVNNATVGNDPDDLARDGSTVTGCGFLSPLPELVAPAGSAGGSTVWTYEGVTVCGLYFDFGGVTDAPAYTTATITCTEFDWGANGSTITVSVTLDAPFAPPDATHVGGNPVGNVSFQFWSVASGSSGEETWISVASNALYNDATYTYTPVTPYGGQMQKLGKVRVLVPTSAPASQPYPGTMTETAFEFTGNWG